MTDKTFDLVVEEDHTLDRTGLAWDGESPPDVISHEDKLLVKVGRYASAGNKYRYRIAVTARLMPDGRLGQLMASR